MFSGAGSGKIWDMSFPEGLTEGNLLLWALFCQCPLFEWAGKLAAGNVPLVTTDSNFSAEMVFNAHGESSKLPSPYSCTLSRKPLIQCQDTLTLVRSCAPDLAPPEAGMSWAYHAGQCLRWVLDGFCWVWDGFRVGLEGFGLVLCGFCCLI